MSTRAAPPTVGLGISRFPTTPLPQTGRTLSTPGATDRLVNSCNTARRSVAFCVRNWVVIIGLGMADGWHGRHRSSGTGGGGSCTTDAGDCCIIRYNHQRMRQSRTLVGAGVSAPSRPSRRACRSSDITNDGSETGFVPSLGRNNSYIIVDLYFKQLEGQFNDRER